MKKRLMIAAAVVAVALSAVAVRVAAQKGQAAAPDVSVLSQGLVNADSREQFLTFSDAGAWSAFWTPLAAGGPAPLPVPDFDFSAHDLAVYVAGVKTTAGHTVSLSLTQHDGKPAIAVNACPPAPDAMTAQMLTAPAAALVLPKGVNAAWGTPSCAREE